MVKPCTRLRCRDPSARRAAGSDRASLRHMDGSAYGCFLPNLTGFTVVHCEGPGRQRLKTAAVLTPPTPQAGIRPRYSGLRVQGTATSPSSTAV